MKIVVLRNSGMPGVAWKGVFLLQLGAASLAPRSKHKSELHCHLDVSRDFDARVRDSSALRFVGMTKL